MLKRKDTPLAILIILLVCSEGTLAKKSRGGKRKQHLSSSNDITTRSALIGIKPEDIATNGTQDSRNLRKSGVGLLYQLPELQDEKHLTEKTLEYSELLSPLDQRLVKEFYKETGEGEDVRTNAKPNTAEVNYLNPSSEPKATDNVNRYSREVTDPVMGDGLGQTEEFNPLRDPEKDEFSNPRNVDLDKDILRQLSQLEGEGLSTSNVKPTGHISDIYKDNPLPEYSYKESNEGAQVSEYRPEEGYSKFYKDNLFEMPKSYYQQDQQLIDAYSREPEKGDHYHSENADLFSVIGKKVLLNLLQHRNKSQNQTDQYVNQDFLRKLLGEQFPTNQMVPTPSMQQRPKVGSSQISTSPTHTTPSIGKISSNVAQTPTTAQVTRNTTRGMSLQILGHLPKGDLLAPNQDTKMTIQEEAPTTRTAFPTQKQPSDIEIHSDNTAASNEIFSTDGHKTKENLVTLKISSAGRPVSFKADTSKDGSLVLKIPGNVTFMNSAETKGTEEISLNSEKSNSMENALYTQTGQVGQLALESNAAGLRDFAKKGKMVLNGVDNLEELGDWQILGKTNPTPDQEGNKSQGEARKIIQAANRILSSAQPTRGRLTYRLNEAPTAPRRKLSSMTNSDLSSVSFSGVGQTPPFQLFPPYLRLRQNVPLRSLLRPSKFLEDSADARGKLRFGSVYGGEKKPSQDAWNMWSPCSVTCGQGIQARARLCVGMKCQGYRTESRTCFKESCPGQLAKAGLRLHNKFRAWHRSPPLKWSDRLAAKAQHMADNMANSKSLHLSDMKESSGVNTAQLWHSYDIAAEKATADWYSEVKSFNFDDPQIDDSTKHFTQLIWKASKEVGIGAAKSRDGEYTFVVALYDPPGNIRSEERENIHIPRSMNE